MEDKLFDSELRVLDLLWDQGELPAREIAAQLQGSVEWSKTTTYTVLKKCVEKGLITRAEPGFRCQAAVSRQEAQRRETRGLIDRMYGGSADRLVASLLEGKALSAEELRRLRKLVEELS